MARQRQSDPSAPSPNEATRRERPAAPRPTRDAVKAEAARLGQESLVIRDNRVVRRYSALLEAMLKVERPSPPGSPGAAAPAPVAAADELLFRQLLGERVGDSKYIIRKELQSGGMGRLYYVFDQDFQRTAVMKVLLPELKTDLSLCANFLREARITAQLEHPNIVPVHDLGYMAGAGIFFTMKYVQGESLHQILEKLEENDPEYLKRFDYIAVLSIIRRVCDAVAFAHSRGILHRDIKPHNIMVGEYGEVLLMDWGLARRFRQPEDDDRQEHADSPPPPDDRAALASATSYGVLKGSPGYMSPEQARGDNELLDARSDIFLIGATLYHLFTYFPPFMGATLEDILASARNGVFLPPETINFGSGQIPEDICRIINRCMQMKQEDRYQTMAELSEDLDAVLHGRARFPRADYATGELLMQEGEEGGESYIIEEGEVEVSTMSEERKVTLGRLGPGDIVGEMALINDERRSATVVALRPTRVLVITKTLFSDTLRKMPVWMARSFVALADRLRLADRRIAGQQ